MASPHAEVFDESARWRLSREASIRDEAFGALAYDHGTRRLVFLKSRSLVEVVRRLDEFECARDAVMALAPESQRGVTRALASLAAAGIIRGD